MTGRLLAAARCMKRRVEAGEDMEAVLGDYRLLSDAEKAEIVAGWEDISTARVPANAEMAAALETLGVDVNG